MEKIENQNVNEILSKNLVRYRTLAEFTQAELAEKINYSDKSISKWERGEGLPDVNVLLSLCKIYGITMNDFFETDNDKNIMPKKHYNRKHIFISLLSGTLVWFIAAFVFAILCIVPQTRGFAWFSFIYAIPVCAIVMTVFSILWGNTILKIIATSFIDWGVLLSVCLSLNIINSYVWILCAAGGFFELLIILWYIFYDKFKSKRNEKI